MRMRVDQRGFDNQLRQALDPREISQAVITEIRKGAAGVQGDIVRSIQNSPPTGKTYRRGNITHTASSAGNPPRTDTGRLVQSVRVEPRSDGADIVVATEYAVHLEYGTRNMAPRPFLGPAAERAADDLTNNIRAAMRREWGD